MRFDPDHIYSVYLAVDPYGRGYIGCTSQTVDQRWAGHTSYPRPWPGYEKAELGDAISHFGKAAFVVTQIASAKGVDAARETETACITQHGTLRPNGYNRIASSHLQRKPPVRRVRAASVWIPPSLCSSFPTYAGAP